ncbi:MAG TPA: hypothetical protein VHW09_04625 [Bryobacteraceae bacterium]|jgi:tetratricopeptide (TPR) repeat protein|nr:hypothetical protein [Bryobacteraceae bacterium]
MTATFRNAGLLAICFTATVWAQGLMAPKDAMPTAQEMAKYADPALLQQFAQYTAQLNTNPRNVAVLTNRGVVSMTIARKSPMGVFWLYAAAKDLEKAIQLAPNDFYAHHNYAEVCFRYGDSPNDHSAQLLAIREYTRAIQIKPDSARSYMGRSWAYLMLQDEARAAADAPRTLQLDPRLRADLENEANGIRERNRQSACAQQTVQRMGAYMVNHSARTAQQCAAIKGFWTAGECRISTAMAPGPMMADGRDAATANAGLSGQGCGPVDATDHKYSPRAGGYVVK